MAVLQRTKASAISALVGIAAAVALSMSAPAGAQQKAPAAGKGEQFFPVLSISHRCVRAQRRTLGQRLRRLSEAGQRAGRN